MSSPDQTFIEARQERYRNAHNSLDVDTLLAWFSEGIYYSDHGTDSPSMTKTFEVKIFHSDINQGSA